MATKDESIKVLAENRKARHDYHLEDFMETGIVLSGAEVKSIRKGGLSLQESYVKPLRGEVWLLNAHINNYSHDTTKEYNPIRDRKLLLHKKEISRLIGKVEQKGCTLVAVKAYLKLGKVKLEIALGKGKNTVDKRQDLKAKESKRTVERALKNHSDRR